MEDKKRRVRIMLDKKISEKKKKKIKLDKNEVFKCQHAYAWLMCAYVGSLHVNAY